MPRPKASTTLSSLVDDSTSDFDFQMPTPDSANEKAATMDKKKKNVRAKTTTANKVTKQIAPVRRRKSVAAKVAKVAPKKRVRSVLSEKVNARDDGNETEEVDEFDQLEDDLLNGTIMTEGDELNQVVVEEEKKKKKKNKKSPAASIEPKEKTVKKQEAPSSTAVITKKEAPTKRAIRGDKIVAKIEEKEEPCIQETQADPMDIDELELDETKTEDILAIDETTHHTEDTMQTEEQEPTPKPIKKSARLPPQPTSRDLTARPVSHPRQPSTTVSRLTNTSEDPNLRRKVGELTSKVEATESRYQALRDIGVVQAESKFDQLKKQSELSASTAKSLIQTLKSTISVQDAQLKESKALKKQFAVQAAELTLLQDEIKTLNDKLIEAQRTNKQLSATLAAKRVAASTVESVANTRVPGSAMKPGIVRMVGSQEAAQEAEKASLKEDVYGDLTGLLIRKVTRNDDEDVFDCIQTGRNGSLHFHLAINNGESFDEAQCTYEPQLDSNRDRDLIDMLSAEADYLCDEISFPRAQAARFYGRMSRALTERRD